jgi:hypothetical protein
MSDTTEPTESMEPARIIVAVQGTMIGIYPPDGGELLISPDTAAAMVGMPFRDSIRQACLQIAGQIRRGRDATEQS